MQRSMTVIPSPLCYRRDRSMSPRGRHSSYSPPHRSSLTSSRDEPWRQSSPTGQLPHQPQYPHVQPPQPSYEVMAPPPSNMYSEVCFLHYYISNLYHPCIPLLYPPIHNLFGHASPHVTRIFLSKSQPIAVQAV